MRGERKGYTGERTTASEVTCDVISKYDLIYERLRTGIEEGDYAYQSFLPSENALCTAFSCARNTVRRAIAGLIERGYAQPIQGKGVRVIYSPAAQSSFFIGGIETFQESAARNGMTARTRVVRFAKRLADAKLAERTGFSEGTPLFSICRVRHLDGVPLILDYNFFHAGIVRDLTAEIAARSVYEHIERTLSLRIAVSRRRMSVERATDEDKAHLALGDYNCLAVVRSQTFDASGEQIEYTVSRHHPERFAFEDTAVRKSSHT